MPTPSSLNLIELNLHSQATVSQNRFPDDTKSTNTYEYAIIAPSPSLFFWENRIAFIFSSFVLWEKLLDGKHHARAIHHMSTLLLQTVITVYKQSQGRVSWHWHRYEVDLYRFTLGTARKYNFGVILTNRRQVWCLKNLERVVGEKGCFNSIDPSSHSWKNIEW